MVVVSLQAYFQALPLERHQQQAGHEYVHSVSWAAKRSKLVPLPYRSPSCLHRYSQPQRSPSIRSPSPSPASIITLCEQGNLSAALDALPLLVNQPCRDVHLAILAACKRSHDVNVVKQYGRYLVQHNVDLTDALGIGIVETLARRGCIVEALHAFHSLNHRPISLWILLMSTCNQHKQSEKTLELYELMLGDGVEPDEQVLACVLKACSALRNLQLGKKVHADARTKGITLDVYVYNSLVKMYGKCGEISEAEEIFIAMPEHNITSWTSMMSVYVDVGQGEKALLLYRNMLAVGFCPNQHTFAVAIQACCVLFDQKKLQGTPINLMCLEIGQALHADACRWGCCSNVFVSTSLIHMYGKLGTIQDAENVFSLVSHFDSIMCNAMIYAYIEKGQAEAAMHLYRHMLLQGVWPSEKTFVLAVQACRILAENEESVVTEGRAVKLMAYDYCCAFYHDAKKRGFTSNIFLRTTFLGAYAKCGYIGEAEMVFLDFDGRPDIVSWTAMISGYVETGNEETALQLFRQMKEEGIQPNTQTYVVAIQACASLGEKADNSEEWKLPLEIGMALHADARQKGLDSNIILKTSLLSMYGMCGHPINAEMVFSKMQCRDLIAWNAMLNAHGEQNEKRAIQMYQELLEEGMAPNEKTFVSVLHACGNLLEKEKVNYMPKLVAALHDDVRKHGFSSNVYIANSLITVYGIMGYLEEAEAVFNGMLNRKIISYNAMLSTYVQLGQSEKALQLYQSIHRVKEINVNDVTLVCILQACIQAGNLELLKQIHFSIVASGNELNPSLASTLICAYGNCGSLHDVKATFDSLSVPDVVSWNACIAAFAGEGCFQSSIQLVSEMQATGFTPDAITVTSVLSACSHSGFLSEGLKYFEAMCRNFNIVLGPSHFSSLADLLGRAGDIQCLEVLLELLPSHTDLKVWLPLLGACCLHGNASLAKEAFDRSLSQRFEDASAFIIMSNVYADSASHEFMVMEDDG